ncbi:MAG: hydrogenase maturation protease [Candidatus Fraserbacteria bacterium RBG_16_55_9]|uniref:Hydrogenase maturation protease n=1 Tax=Fraserbacteria sp. (strain RBG_16_55_9) TaxID=1817864 RepID=A0A1F5UYW5_FRAXR|nr:MAG: hydrogenase maturation protease [Candidatus Fraserbacteria bacterium RBG_16_55_9]
MATVAQQERARTEARILIIGVGSAYRRDDAVGLIIAQRLRAKKLNHVQIREESGEGTSLMESWKDADTLILIDAVHSGAAPGTLYRLNAHRQTIPTDFFHYSTHAFSVAEAIELARALNQLPRRLIVHGIEGENFEMGEGLSPEVEKATEEALRLVLLDLRL